MSEEIHAESTTTEPIEQAQPEVESVESIETESPEAKPEEGEEAKVDEEVEHRKRSAKDRIEQLARQKNDIRKERDYWRERALNFEGSKKELAELKDEELSIQESKVNMEEWSQKLQAATLEYSDFEAVVMKSDAHIETAVSQAVLKSKDSTDILYFLGKNPETLKRLNETSGQELFETIGEIRAEIKAGKAKVKEVLAKTSNAPEPIKPIAKNTVVVKRPEDMNHSEYVAYRRSQGANY